jgi:CYTH domain-containing protein
VEIERKFLVEEPPDLDGAERMKIAQGYLSLARDGGAEVRLRRADGSFFLTVKGGEGLSRVEEEVEMDRDRFESLWRLTEGQRVMKTRHVIPHGDRDIELDVYEDELEGLLTAEVEFPDEEAAEAFEPPDWFGEDVTGNTKYLNETLATEGRPA